MGEEVRVVKCEREKERERKESTVDIKPKRLAEQKKSQGVSPPVVGSAAETCTLDQVDSPPVHSPLQHMHLSALGSSHFEGSR